jgi:hypothetical protein
VAAMDAIEIADGEHCAFCLRRYVPPAGNDIHPSVLINARSLPSSSAFSLMR